MHSPHPHLTQTQILTHAHEPPFLPLTKSGTPRLTQITKPHKHTQQSITEAYRKDKIRRCRLFGNGENEGKQKNIFE